MIGEPLYFREHNRPPWIVRKVIRETRRNWVLGREQYKVEKATMRLHLNGAVLYVYTADQVAALMQTPEEIAKALCYNAPRRSGMFSGFPNWDFFEEQIADALRQYGDDRAAAERERCAKIADASPGGYEVARVAATIRELS